MNRAAVHRIILLLFSIFLLLPSQSAAQSAPGQGTTAVVTVPLANVLKGPDIKSGLRTQVLLAEPVTVLEKQGYRYRIAIPGQGGIKGWVHQEALSVPKSGTPEYLAGQRPWIVIARPKTRALILDQKGNHKVSLYAGTRLAVVEENAEGYTVQFPDRTRAIVNRGDARQSYSAALPDEDLSAEVASAGRQFQGVPSLDGGLTAQGIDTDGLIHVAYRMQGITVSRDREARRAQAMKVPKSELKPGDVLVFYGEGEGLYLGKGQFLHAVRKSSVQLGGIHDKRYANALQHCLRIIGADPAERKRPSQMTADEILDAQGRIALYPLHRRIVWWAVRFINTPYDPDPLGLYVRSNRIVTDEKVDCMYHTFRSVELAMTTTPAEAIEKALDLRFLTKGKLADGIVQNYDERFQYGEDMVFSGKWGRNITADLGAVRTIPGSRGRDTVEILPKEVLATRAMQKGFRDGDIIFWIKDPKKRVVEEIVAHLSIIRVKKGAPYVIHAAGSKSKNQWTTADGGKVKEVPLAEYVANMRFIGAMVTRFEE